MRMDDDRPNPDAVLAQARAAEERAGRGKLKIFFGFAAGVGKTYAMLEAAHGEVYAGRDVAIGIVETHGRRETAALLLGMDILPLATVEYRDAQFKEFDLDGALKRRPDLLVVDELAHTNTPGCRHVKRWQDIEELLSAGIDVYTTVNVQHVESLNDVVSQITGITVRETIPDSLLERADEIELVDLPPDDLLERFRTGRVYVPAQAQRAMDSFFKRPTLIALRELALRRMAERVGIDAETARLNGRALQTWPTRERILVCVSPSPLSPRVVRSAKRMAGTMRAEWIAAYVERLGHEQLDSESRRRLTQNVRLAEQLGAEVVTLAGRDAADELLSYARRRNVSRIVVGRSGDRPWNWLPRRTLVDELLRGAREIDIHVIHGGEPARPTPRGSAGRRDRPIEWGGYIRAAAIVAACAASDAFIFYAGLAEANLVMVLLLGVVYAAARYGRGPGMFASVAGVLVFDFFFVPPYLTFSVSDTQYLITFAVMLGIAVLTSSLTSHIQEQARLSRQRERRAEALYRLSRQLSVQAGLHTLVQVALQHLAETFGGEVAIFLLDAQHRLEAHANTRASFAAHEHEGAVAQWVFDRQQPAGRGTDTLPNAQAFYLPLIGSQGPVGVLGLHTTDDQPLLHDQRQLLETFASQIAGTLEREALAAQVRAVLVQAETERLRNSLLSSVSHDLRTPLAGIAGASSSLLRSADSLTANTRQDLYRTIFDEAHRLGRLVDNLLDMTRIESGGVTVNKQWHLIEEVLGSALRRAGEALAGRTVTTNVPDSLTLVPLDDLLIEQALIHLLENAGRYTPPGSPLEINVVEEAGRVLISISDRGPGLPPAEEGRVFDKFYRGAAGSADGRRGAGLGLAICRAIVTAHGGKAWAENRSGGGATFFISLPLEGGRPPVAS